MIQTAFILADEGIHTITFRDLVETVTARDLATIMEIIEVRRAARRGPGEVGVANFH